MKAKLIYREKYVCSDGAIREMILWKLPQKTSDRPHGLKYSLYSRPAGFPKPRRSSDTEKLLLRYLFAEPVN
ncbi:MAG: hypothetical protein GY749_02795 [Desulfobacteraceae bacterium]|nr:hypothetical protein [Desulfobacteraceae bacterium]